jgi:glycosyltransferase involved in cell wall biosynthesis
VEVVAAGRIGPQRRPEACARILEAVKDLAPVAWIGGGPAGSPGAAALKSAGVPVTGWLPRDEAVSRLAGATVYLHWTGWDGLPLSILEAMARDVVVVASDIGPNREVLGAAQVRTSERDAIELLRSVLTAPAHRDELLEAQRRRRTAYGADRMVSGWLDLYQRLLL